MSILTDVDRQAPRTRLAIGVTYALLMLGSVTMIYPFLIMVSSASTDSADYNEYRIVPRYLYDKDKFFAKYWYLKHVGDGWSGARRPALLAYQRTQENYNEITRNMDYFPHLHPDSPEYVHWKDARVQRRVRDYQEFKFALPEEFTRVDFWTSLDGMTNAQRYQDWLKRKYQSIDNLNRAYGSDYEVFSCADIRPHKVGSPVHRWPMPFNYFRFLYIDHNSPHYRDWLEWRREELTGADISACDLDPYYQYHLMGQMNGIDEYNALCGTHCRFWHEIRMPEAPPDNPRLRTLWESIVRRRVALVHIRLIDAQNEFTRYLRQEYGTVQSFDAAKAREFADTLGLTYRPAYTSIDIIPLPERYPESDPVLYKDWAKFVDVAPLEALRVIRPERMYQEFLQQRYASVQDMNAAYGTQFASFAEVPPPAKEEDTITLFQNRWQWLRHFLFYSYIKAFEELFSKGGALINTLILVGAHVAIQLTVNPLAAYALSRYRLSYGNKVLLFMVVTMAFPAEVAMIPSFLMVREMHLLNTYWAILLPWMAQGFFVFLLKGFFDSLPKELFEQATIDGASELRMFWQIAVPICSPIFAVIALSAFQAMYGAFMFALIVCQEKAKWPLMVFIYQYQQTPGVTDADKMAALVLTVIPTLVVFLAVQKVILRGIIIPQMK
ncbi:MAG TPA: ABC transporter permease subunit [Candidatus Hydrogenedentes bacterium]|nr:ABC transporter permease subunit [Candidatus Hydrogenedentota bacterium]HQH52600.1 ABC transporter permease subunit [Candidatus Hydrogenedentota bacterium]